MDTSMFSSTTNSVLLGSGTARLSFSALGRPSMIGVEDTVAAMNDSSSSDTSRVQSVTWWTKGDNSQHSTLHRRKVKTDTPPQNEVLPDPGF